jgi:hypothetical protein
MRFLSKYDLTEQLTLGALETFRARSIGGGEPLLVHLFSLPLISATELSNSDLLRSFEQVAPLPPGAIVDAGRYDDGTQAFVVSKTPLDTSALQAWLQHYRAQALEKEKTAELQALPVRSDPAIPTPSESEEATPSNPGEFTRAFQIQHHEMSHSITATAISVPDPATPLQELSVPHTSGEPVEPSLTQEFLRGASEPEHTLPKIPQGAPTADFRGSEFRLEEPAQGGHLKPVFTKPFNTVLEVPPKPEAPRAASSEGEFTKFFSGPFTPSATDRPLKPVEISKPISGSGGGEFTALFGSGSSGSFGVPSVPLVEPSSQTAPESFTSVFEPTRPSPTPARLPTPSASPSLNNDPRLGYRGSSSTPLNPAISKTRIIDPPPSHPISPGASHSKMTAHPDPAAPGDGATRIFVPEEARMPASPISSASDASAYEHVIQGGRSGAPLATPATPRPTPSLDGTPSFNAVSPSSLSFKSSKPPAAVPAPMPPPLQGTGPFAPPTPSAISTLPATPPPPGMALAPKPEAGWGAYTPAITILALLFVAAIGLVLFFALRH